MSSDPVDEPVPITSQPGPVADSVDALAADGGVVTIRSVSETDREALARLYGDASADSLRLRFFGQPSAATLTAEVERLCRPPDRRHLAVLAVEAGAVVGVASCECLEEHPDRAEFAMFVADGHRDRGIGTLLLEHLGARARHVGITELSGEVLPGNIGMLRVARDLSTRAWSRFDQGVVDVVIGIDGEGQDAEPAVDARERIAERASLRPVLSPRSVAVVGAGHTRGGVGHETLRAIREYGFTRRLYAVNRTGHHIDGTPGYRSVRDLPAPVDLLVIAVPADQVAGVLADAAAAEVRGAVVLSAGFGEQGEDGRRRQADLVRLARDHGIRLIGPNCLGVANTDPSIRLNASFAPAPPTAGGLAVAAQSGAVGIALLDGASRTGCGISTFVSLGNKADVSGNDLIAYWYDDPATRAVALYLESFGNPRKFARTVRALSRRKPVVAIKSGRSDAGKRAGASHTAAAAAPSATVDALFAQAGVIRVETLGEMIDAARQLTDQPLPGGNRLAIIGNAGGLNVLAADAAEAHGLSVPALTERLRNALATAVPGAAGLDNPLDLGAGAGPAAFAAAAEAVAANGQADTLLLLVIGTRTNIPAGILAALAPVVDRHPDLPMAAVVIGTADDTPTLGHRRVPVFDLPERAVAALAHAARYAAWRREPLGRRPDLAGVDRELAQSLVQRALTCGGSGWQPYDRTATILGAYGIATAPTMMAQDATAAIASAERLGYPVVLKSADPDLVHKTDTGGVRTGLTDADTIRAAYRDVIAAGRPEYGVLVQKQMPIGIELVAGIVHDPLFGSVVMLGLGGVQTDLLGDRTLRLVPMTDLDAGRMWRSLRAAPLLTGYRGAPAVDTAALEDLLLRLGRLAEDLPEVAELDLNPVTAGPDGVLAVDAKLRLAPIGDEPDPTLRRLSAAGRAAIRP